jgi:two-component system, OmpR family, sensor histidine kinase KdpD
MPSPIKQRPDPDKLLHHVEAEEERSKRGRLKVFLGYSSGVGKSLRMLNEGRRRLERGEDVIVGATQPESSPEAREVLRKLEIVSLCSVNGEQVMDVETILQRRPQVCLVDGLAYDNPPGSRNAKRWQDVEELLQNGISVVTSVNLQYIEERRAEVEKIRGKSVTQTIPESFLRMADEIEVVDAPAQSCLLRTPGVAGDLDGGDEQKKLSELRGIALLLAADVVEQRLEDYLKRHGISQTWGTQERFLVWVTPWADSSGMIASGRRNADRFHGELCVAHLAEPDLSPSEQAMLRTNLECAEEAGAKVAALDGADEVATLLQFAREHSITQIFVGHGARGGVWQRLFGGPLDRIIRESDGIDVRIFPL